MEDKNAAQAFTAKYEAMHRWRKLSDGAQMLLVGADNFAFPIPLKKNAGGQWFFDTAAGKDEVLSRRIGRNELAIIEACRAVADAQAEYFSQVHDGETTKQYAASSSVTPASRTACTGKPRPAAPEPTGTAGGVRFSEGYSTKPEAHKAFHGYYFRILKGQTENAPGGAKDYVLNGKMVGGFAFIAYPGNTAIPG